jgi:hypothetical protein
MESALTKKHRSKRHHHHDENEFAGVFESTLSDPNCDSAQGCKHVTAARYAQKDSVPAYNSAQGSFDNTAAAPLNLDPARKSGYADMAQRVSVPAYDSA